jgi:hypothetical protein
VTFADLACRINRIKWLFICLPLTQIEAAMTRLLLASNTVKKPAYSANVVDIESVAKALNTSVNDVSTSAIITALQYFAEAAEHNVVNRSRIVENGGVEAVVSAMSTYSSNARAMETACLILGNLACQADLQVLSVRVSRHQAVGVQEIAAYKYRHPYCRIS